MTTINPELCQICFNKSINVIDVFSSSNECLKIPEIISKHFWFEINPNDQYTIYICTKCWEIISNFHQFYEFIEQIQLQPLTKVEPIFECIKHEYDSLSAFDTAITVEAIEYINDLALDNEMLSSTSREICKTLKPRTSSRRILNNNVKDKKSKSNEFVEIKIRKKSAKSKDKIKNKKLSKIDKQLEDQRKQIGRAKNQEDDVKIGEFFKLDCQECSEKSFPTFLAVKTHFRLNHATDRGYIACCNKKLFRKGAVLEHLEWHTNPDAFRCLLCNKQYNDSFGLKLHNMDIHTPEDLKLFQCDICQKSFIRKNAMAQHILSRHAAKINKQHVCNQCGKCFGTRSLLLSHIRNVHTTASHVCDICAKLFKTLHQYLQHKKNKHSISNEERLRCELCGSWQKSKQTLKVHMSRTHEEDPKVCTICSKECRNKEAFKRHMRIHNKIRQYECHLCDKSFKVQLNLKEHIACHTGYDLYTCPYCPKTFKSSANKYAHVKRGHPFEWDRDRKKPIEFILT